MRRCSPPLDWTGWDAAIPASRSQPTSCFRRRRRARSGSRHGATAGRPLLVRAIDDPATHAMCIAAERGLLAALGADCHSPVAAMARLAERYADDRRRDPHRGRQHARIGHRRKVRAPRTSVQSWRVICSIAHRPRSDAFSPDMHAAVLRPEPGNGVTAARLEAAGLTPIRCPLFAVMPVLTQPAPARRLRRRVADQRQRGSAAGPPLQGSGRCTGRRDRHRHGRGGAVGERFRSY